MRALNLLGIAGIIGLSANCSGDPTHNDMDEATLIFPQIHDSVSPRDIRVEFTAPRAYFAPRYKVIPPLEPINSVIVQADVEDMSPPSEDGGSEELALVGFSVVPRNAVHRSIDPALDDFDPYWFSDAPVEDNVFGLDHRSIQVQGAGWGPKDHIYTFIDGQDSVYIECREARASGRPSRCLLKKVIAVQSVPQSRFGVGMSVTFDQTRLAEWKTIAAKAQDFFSSHAETYFTGESNDRAPLKGKGLLIPPPL